MSLIKEYMIRLVRKGTEFPVSKELTRNNKWMPNGNGGMFTETEALRIEQSVLRTIKQRWNQRHYYTQRTGKVIHPMSAYTLIISKIPMPKSSEPTLRDIQRFSRLGY